MQLLGFKDYSKDQAKRIDAIINLAKRKTIGNIARENMPQIRSDAYDDFLKFLDERKIRHTKETVPASKIGFIQGEFHKEKIESLLQNLSVIAEKIIFVSKDYIVLDGNHRILAKQVLNGNVKVIKIDRYMSELINIVKEFNKVKYAK